MLKELAIRGVRNLGSVTLRFDQGFNLFTGANAAGKTSILEAIHLLARARSFRAGRLEQVISRDEDFLRVTGVLEQAGSVHRMGVERSRASLRVRLNGQDVRVLSRLAVMLPVQVINTETQRLLQDGPGARRVFLNWACFHDADGYHGSWQRYERALRQRNAALRTADGRLAGAWEPELAEAAYAVDEFRLDLSRRLQQRLQSYLDAWLPEAGVMMEYRRGWGADTDLLEQYRTGRDREQEAGYTLHGPHRADLQMRAMGLPAQHGLSRGQQKLLAVALVLAQVAELRRGNQTRPLVLVDDLAAELDLQRCQQVITGLEELDVQVVLTAIEAGDLPGVRAARMYRLEGGQALEVV